MICGMKYNWTHELMTEEMLYHADMLHKTEFYQLA